MERAGKSERTEIKSEKRGGDQHSTGRETFTTARWLGFTSESECDELRQRKKRKKKRIARKLKAMGKWNLNCPSILDV